MTTIIVFFVLIQVFDYLVESAACNQTLESVQDFLLKVEKFHLQKQKGFKFWILGLQQLLKSIWWCSYPSSLISILWSGFKLIKLPR